MIRVSRTGFTTRKQGQKRLPKPSCETTSRNAVFVLLAILALATASHGFAQQSNFASSDGLYAMPDASQSANFTRESTGNRSTQSHMGELDPQEERFKLDRKKAEAARQEAASAKRLKYMTAGGESVASSSTLSTSERTWIAILAGGGILVSLAAGGYIWWSRTQSSRANLAILLPVKRKPAAKPVSTEKQDNTTERRAA